MVENLLRWNDWKHEFSKAVCERDEFFKHVVYPETINYFLFMEIIITKADIQESEIQENWLGHAPSSLERLLKDYYKEIVDYYNEKAGLSEEPTFRNPFTSRKMKNPS